MASQTPTNKDLFIALKNTAVPREFNGKKAVGKRVIKPVVNEVNEVFSLAHLDNDAITRMVERRQIRVATTEEVAAWTKIQKGGNS